MRATSRMRLSLACASGDCGPCVEATLFSRFASGPRKTIPLAAESVQATSPKMSQNWL